MRQSSLFKSIGLLLFSLISILSYAQTMTKKVEDDGFVWYRVSDGELYGAQDANHKVLLDTKFESISYDYGLITENAFPYFCAVYPDGVYELYNVKGGCVVNRDRNFHYIDVRNLFSEYPYGYYLTVWDSNGHYGICDINGVTLVEPKYKFAKVRAMEENGRKYFQYHLTELDGRTHFVDMQGNDWGDLCLFYSGGKLCLAKDMKKMADISSFPTTNPFSSPASIWKAERREPEKVSPSAIPYSELSLSRLNNKHFRVVGASYKGAIRPFEGDLSLVEIGFMFSFGDGNGNVESVNIYLKEREVSETTWDIRSDLGHGNIVLFKEYTHENPNKLMIGLKETESGSTLLFILENHPYDKCTLK